jgi:hypothetical protein
MKSPINIAKGHINAGGSVAAAVSIASDCD